MRALRKRQGAMPVVLASVLLLGSGTVVQAGETERVSVDSTGTQGNRGGGAMALSANGQLVTFVSGSSNLVAGDTNGFPDIFVHDLTTGETERVSVDSAGTQGNNISDFPALSATGQFVAFEADASNLVAGDTNRAFDVFVHDRKTGKTERVSEDSAGTQGNDNSFNSALSANGQVVAFASFASNLVAGDTNGTVDIFVHDRQTGETERVSVDSAGKQGNGPSGFPVLSATGRFVAFTSFATNLVRGDTNGTFDIFVHDRKTGKTERVSVDSAGAQGNGESSRLALSTDGRFVAFASSSSNLVAGDTNGFPDIFVHDRKTGKTERVSVDSAGAQGNSDSSDLTLSTDGRFVAFQSNASNLVVGDTNGAEDVFVHDRQTGKTERVSVDSAGTQGNGSSFAPVALSADGQVVAFDSAASNLVVLDTNGFTDTFVHVQ